MREIDFSKNIWILAFIALTFIFGVVARLEWVSYASGNDSMVYNGEVMINTNDGYYFAEGARDIIAGFHQENDLSPVENSMSKTTAFLYKILPGVSFESVILYMSVFFSSLLVVPIMLIAREFRAPEVGIIAGLVGVIGNSYYNRTMAGYYDTDMLNIVLPLFVLWGMINFLNKNKITPITPIFVVISLWWYSSSFTLLAGFLAIFFIYVLIFDRKNLINYQFMTLYLVGLSGFYPIFKFIAIFILYFAFLKNSKNLNLTSILGVIVLILFIVKGGLNPIIFQLRFYILRDLAEVKESFFYFNVNQTIMESSLIDASYFMERISSNENLFVLSLVGYALFCFKHRAFLLSLPMLLFGFLALKSGLRFTIYAVPIMALGLGYLVYFVMKFLEINSTIRAILAFTFGLVFAIPAISHIYEYKVSPVFIKDEVEILANLKSVASREDYALAWWDYGYPIRYYSDVKTLIDGGKHLGKDNFPVSFALTKDQVSSANMARVAVEYTELNFDQNFTSIESEILSRYSLEDMDDLFALMSLKSFETPAKTREIYYYLPYRMMDIYPVVAKFSDIDIKTGRSFSGAFFYTDDVADLSMEMGITLSSGIQISPDLKNIYYKKERLKTKNYIEAGSGEDNRVVKMDSNGDLNIIFLKDYGRKIVLLDDRALNSTFVQLFMLENYDPDLFEPVILDPLVKIYRLKI